MVAGRIGFFSYDRICYKKPKSSLQYLCKKAGSVDNDCIISRVFYLQNIKKVKLIIDPKDNRINWIGLILNLIIMTALGFILYYWFNI